MRTTWFVVLVGVTAAMALGGPTLSGSLSYDTGITGLTEDNTNPWLATGTQLEWWVTDNDNGTFTYKYTLTVANKNISHFIIEVSPAFTEDNIWDAELYGTTVAVLGPTTYSEGDGNSNPGMPEPVFGVKFEPAEGYEFDATIWTVEFESDRAPVWGDFYSVDGKKEGSIAVIWNAGYTAADPTAPAGNGSLDGHLLVPDTTGIIIPAPGALGLAALGLGLVASRRRR